MQMKEFEMGVDCSILLPNNVRIRDVATVIGACVGFKPYRRDFGKDNEGWATYSDGIRYDIASDPSYVTMRFDNRFASYHYEVSENPGSRLLYVKSTAFWGCIGKRLVDFFGGKVDYNDCDAIDWDYEVPKKSNSENCPTNGDEWTDLQQRMLDVKGLTEPELLSMTRTNYTWLEDKKQYEYKFDDDGHMIRNSSSR